MLTHPTLDKLHAVKLHGMVQALSEQSTMPDITALNFEERLGLLVDREMSERDNRRLKTRLHQAKLRQNACIEDLDYRHPRGLDKSLMTRLALCQWIRDRHNVLITGPKGIGKTWIACALGQKACREGWTALYLRLPRFLQELPMAKGDGRYVKLLMVLAKIDVLLLDDFGLALGCRTFLSCISKGFGGFCSRLLRLRTGKLSSAFRLHSFADIFGHPCGDILDSTRGQRLGNEVLGEFTAHAGNQEN